MLPALEGVFDDRPDAVRVAGDVMSWQRLHAAAAALAGRIAGASAVAVRATPTMRTCVAVVAGLLADVPIVPVPPDAGAFERDHILRDSGAAMLADAPDAGLDGGWDVSIPTVPVELDARSDTGFPPVDETRPALILYTSGTTGAPKGVVVPRSAIVADLDALAEAWAWTPEDTLTHGLPLFHVHGLVLGVLGALRVGSRLIHTGKPSPEAYAAAGGTLYFGVPTVWSRVCQEPDAARQLASARLLVSGSAPLAEPVFQRLEALSGHRPVERYGMTETLITVSARAAGARRPGMVGVPLSGITTRLVGEHEELLPHDGETVGELQVRGPTLFSGYLGRPEATAETVTADGWFRTGDVAAIDEQGWHRIVGRASTDLIKSGGYRVGAGEIEVALLSHPAVAEAAVRGEPDPDLGQRIVAYVTADGASGASEAELIDFVAGRLSVHKRPRQVHLCDELPRNAMGKIQKKLLTAPSRSEWSAGPATGSAHEDTA